MKKKVEKKKIGETKKREKKEKKKGKREELNIVGRRHGGEYEKE